VTEAPVAIGVDIGGTKILAAMVDGDGAIVASVRGATPQAGGRAILAATLHLVDELRAEHPTRPVMACGVGTAGVVVRNQIVSANTLLPGWAGQPLAEELESALHRPAVVTNDVHAAAFAEVERGAASGASAALFVAVGTGVGGAFSLDGRIRDGRIGVAGSIGHTAAPGRGDRACPCGARGHVEAYAGGRGIERSYAERLGRLETLHEIAARARDGERPAAEVIVEAAEVLGRAIGGAVNLLDPDLVVLGGGVPEIGPLYLDALRRAVRAEAMLPDQAPLVRAEMGANATVIGAALMASRAAA